MILEEFDTIQCHITVYDTQQQFKGFRIYCIISEHFSSEENVIRFGNRSQIKTIINGYGVHKNLVRYREW